MRLLALVCRSTRVLVRNAACRAVLHPSPAEARSSRTTARRESLGPYASARACYIGTLHDKCRTS